MVKKNNFPFRQAYATSSKLVNYAEKKVRLDELSLEEINKFLKKIKIDNVKIFDVLGSMNSKTSYGGTAKKNIKRMIKMYKKFKMNKIIFVFNSFCISIWVWKKNNPEYELKKNRVKYSYLFIK